MLLIIAKLREYCDENQNNVKTKRGLIPSFPRIEFHLTLDMPYLTSRVGSPAIISLQGSPQAGASYIH